MMTINNKKHKKVTEESVTVATAPHIKYFYTVSSLSSAEAPQFRLNPYLHLEGVVEPHFNLLFLKYSTLGFIHSSSIRHI